MKSFAATVPFVTLVSLLGWTPAAHPHATYNLSGYASGIGGSTNGADGSPTAVPPATWSNGPASEYAGALPVNWYCGLHNPTQVRTLTTGLAPNPPSGSQLAQVNSYNTANDPDLPTDTVLAVGGLSWSDPSNGDQGWGHGLDYGIIHISPVDDVLADGPVRMTITLTDDPTDGVAPQLAYALYGGWDTSTTAVRHQTFTTNPSPVDNPLGSTGLTLIDFAVASAPGGTLSRTYDVDTLSGGEYTLLIGALGGVAGQYQVTVGLFPGGQASQEELDECIADLSVATMSLDALTTDADADEVPDHRDACAETAAGQFVDGNGCSQSQFCGNLPVTNKRERNACKTADWMNDEPLMTRKQTDCAFDKKSRLCAPKL
jgi:hypothetical protein